MPIARSCATRRGTVTWPWWYWNSTKRRSSGPKWPTIPAGSGATTVSPSGVSQRSRRMRHLRAQHQILDQEVIALEARAAGAAATRARRGAAGGRG